MQVAVAYEPDAKCPRWDKFLGEVFIDKDGNSDLSTIEFIQRAVGYSLTGHTKEQCLILLHGLGANGKGVFLETLLRVFAEYGDSVNFNSLMRRKVDSIAASPEIAKLRSRRFIIASEVNEGMSWDEAGIKKLTGSDTIVARYLHGNPVTFRPTHKLWFGTNYKPKTRDNNFSFWRRVRVVACRATFKGEKDDKSLSALVPWGETNS